MMIVCFFVCYYASLCFEFGSLMPEADPPLAEKRAPLREAASTGQGGDSSPSIPLSPSRIREDSASCDAGISEPDLPCFCESASRRRLSYGGQKLGEPNSIHGVNANTEISGCIRSHIIRPIKALYVQSKINLFFVVVLMSEVLIQSLLSVSNVALVIPSRTRGNHQDLEFFYSYVEAARFFSMA